MDLVALKAELVNDPLPRGYAVMSDESAANSLNTPNRTPNRESTDAGTILSAMVRSEFDALTTANKDYVRVVLSTAGAIPLTATFRANLAAMFAAGTTTRTNFLALQSRPGSRAEELGLGFVTPSDVANARRLP